VTQPRRIAATSLAERVAAERADSPPGTRGSMVGYHVRLDAAASSSTKLLFCTTGILLRRLQSEPLLKGTSHVIIDEVRNRSETLKSETLKSETLKSETLKFCSCTNNT
jgi:HrpA-like RNA helicase